MARKANGATIAQIASDVGVSSATVSRALNHPEIVHERTLFAIQESLNRLNYDMSFRQKPMAKSKKAVSTIVFVCNSINDTFMSTIIEGATNIVSHQKYNLLLKIVSPDENGYQDLIDTLEEIQPAGIILMAKLSHDEIGKLNKLFPCVQCCEYDGNAICSSVSVDLCAATQNLIYHILSTGRKKIAFMSLRDNPMYIAQQRKNTYHATVKQLDLEENPDWEVLLGEPDFMLAVSSALRVLRMANRPDAFIASSDTYAAAIMKAAAIAGLQVPKDLIICGFDNLEISRAVTPTITTINIPTYQLGYIAGEILIDTVKKPTREKQNIVLETELIVRESSVIVNI